MRGLVEAAVFAGLASAVHLILVLNLAGEPGARGSGSGGEAVTTLEAAPESFAALARAWSEAPDIAAPAAAPEVGEPADAASGRPEPETAQAPDAPLRDTPATQEVPTPPDTPRAERALPAAGPQIPGFRHARASAPGERPAPPSEPADRAAPVQQPPGVPAPARPGGEVSLPAPGPQPPPDAPAAPNPEQPDALAFSDNAPTRDGAAAAAATTAAPTPPPELRAPQGDAAAPAPAPPLAQVAMATESQRRPQPRPERNEARQAAQDSPPRPAPESSPESSAEPSAESAPRPEQQARGAGGGAAAGEREDASDVTLSGAARQNLLASWGGAIRARVEHHKRYPAQARDRRLSGTTTVRLEVARDGRLIAADVAASSGHDVMDRAALDAVRSAGRFPAAPDDLREASFRFDLPVSFRP